MNELKGFDIIFPREYMRAALLVSLLSVWVLVGLFYYLNRYTKRYYFTIWTAAWLFYALWLTLGMSVPQPGSESFLSVLHQWCVSISAVFLLWGSLSFLEIRARQSLLGLFMAFLLVWGYVGRLLLRDPFSCQLPIFVLIGLASAFAGFAFYRARHNRPFVAVGMLVFGFVLWGAYLISYPFCLKFDTLINAGFLFSAVLQLFIAVSMIVLVLEEARLLHEETERHIETINSEKRELQLKVLSAEEKCRALFQGARSREELQLAYDELRETQCSVTQQERLRSLGQLASGIAHDVNNALSPILAFAELILKKETTLSDTGRKNLENIRTSADDIAQIVSRLSDFYRQRDTQEPLRLVSVSQLVRQVIDLTRPCWRDIPQSRGVFIQVAAHLDHSLPAIRCNEFELREALTNLVLNAVDALPAGGVITLVTSQFAVAEPAPQITSKTGHVAIDVVDNGVGMDEATRQRCLEPFFSTKRKSGGSGLGLAMVYGMMERHKGRIEIKSEVGRGTTIRLILPVGENPGFEPPTAASVEPPVTNLKVLCIDDEPLLRELLKQTLELHNYTVETADGGQTGVELFRGASNSTRPFDLVITDLGMPGMDGYQVARHVKSSSPKTPVIMLTGWGKMLEEDNARANDVDAVLSKPPRHHELLETISKVASHRAAAGNS